MKTLPDLPYAYARRHRVCLSTEEVDRPLLYHHGEIPELVWREIHRFVLGHTLIPHALEEEDFERLLQRHYADQGSSSSEVFSNLNFDNTQLDLHELSAAIDEPDDLLSTRDDAPIIRLLNAVFFEAVREKSSDIHIEPYATQLFVRFRIDGVLKTILTTRVALAPLLVSRVKVLAQLDIAEKRVPQDGRLSVRIGGHAVDMRVSTIPSAHGERVVMRLLDKEATRLSLDRLGMQPDLQKQLEKIIRRPHGILLVTGPTGCGKTTTLYACLSEMDSKQLNIMTVEDPVEYHFEGISQTQVNPRTQMSFARGLRAILRQDPDVVLIGEIRDHETAQISVQASLTGHLVLSTLHTNTAVGAITRLRDMGVESFLLASTLQAVLAQRLVRRLCPHCRQVITPDDSTRALLQSEAPIFSAKGCESCYQTGYISRVGVYELLVVDFS